ncbi:hypothetical protein ACIQW5_20385 [Methylorubrum thiocyanatum]|uniref:hypothetical protein n=1 Tax=Methylorubrum thiocyanatum TaxID=47958 RepID=UPI00383AC361
MRRVGFWLGFTALWLAVLYQGGRTTALAQATAALSIAVLVVHAILALGRVRAAAFLAICLTVTFAIENLGVATAIMALFTMLPVALLALMKLAGTGPAPGAERERLDGLPSA